MTVEIGLTDEALAPHKDLGGGLHEIAPDIAYLRLFMVNVVMIGVPEAGDRGWVLVDTGLTGTADKIIEAAKSRFGSASRPAAIIQTHGHFDHVGALAELAQTWDVPVWAHEAERPFLTGSQTYPPPDTKADGGIMPKLAPLFPRAPVDIGPRLHILPADGSIPPLPGWTSIHTPGHTPGHISLWREDGRTLIAGDAFITTGQESAYEVALQKLEMHGPPRYFTPDWQAAARSVQALANLEPDLAITGHGRAVAGPPLRTALRKLADDFEAIAVPEHLR